MDEDDIDICTRTRLLLEQNRDDDDDDENICAQTRHKNVQNRDTQKCSTARQKFVGWTDTNEESNDNRNTSKDCINYNICEETRLRWEQSQNDLYTESTSENVYSNSNICATRAQCDQSKINICPPPEAYPKCDNCKKAGVTNQSNLCSVCKEPPDVCRQTRSRQKVTDICKRTRMMREKAEITGKKRQEQVKQRDRQLQEKDKDRIDCVGERKPKLRNAKICTDSVKRKDADVCTDDEEQKKEECKKPKYVNDEDCAEVKKDKQPKCVEDGGGGQKKAVRLPLYVDYDDWGGANKEDDDCGKKIADILTEKMMKRDDEVCNPPILKPKCVEKPKDICAETKALQKELDDLGKCKKEEKKEEKKATHKEIDVCADTRMIREKVVRREFFECWKAVALIFGVFCLIGCMAAGFSLMYGGGHANSTRQKLDDIPHLN